MILHSRHSGAGRNPAKKYAPQSGHNPTAYSIKTLDSGLRRNDEVAELRNDGILNHVRKPK